MPRGTPSRDPFDLARFVEAQAAVYPQALDELREGRKRSHWSWFIFPQLAGLGASAMSVRFAIGSLDEANAYLAHPLLGERLRECVAATRAHAGLGAVRLLGDVDARKFQSCLTLFAHAAPADRVFADALDAFFDGRPDAATREILTKRG